MGRALSQSLQPRASANGGGADGAEGGVADMG